MAVWKQYTGTPTYHVWSSRFDGENWESPHAVDVGSYSAENPRVISNGAGKFLAVWEQSNGSTWDIWARYYDGSQ